MVEDAPSRYRISDPQHSQNQIQPRVMSPNPIPPPPWQIDFSDTEIAEARTALPVAASVALDAAMVPREQPAIIMKSPPAPQRTPLMEPPVAIAMGIPVTPTSEAGRLVSAAVAGPLIPLAQKERQSPKDDYNGKLNDADMKTNS